MARSKKPATKAPKRKTATRQKTAAKKSPVRKIAAKKAAVKQKQQTRGRAPQKASAAPKKNVNVQDFFGGAYFDPNGPHQKTFEQTMEKIMAKGPQNIDQLTNEAANIGRENAEAIMKSGNIFMKGVEDIMRTAISLAQSSAEKQAQFVKQALSSKTLNEWTDIQNKIAQANFDDFMAGATRISELGVKVLTESVEPVNNQVTKAMQQASQAIAA